MGNWDGYESLDADGYELETFEAEVPEQGSEELPITSFGYGDREYGFTCTMKLPSNETKASDVLQEVAEQQQAKNADYGSSWQKTGELKEVLADGTLPHIETAEEAVMDGLYTRMLDKLSRGYTLAFLNDSREVDDEALADTFRDLAGYAAMAAAQVENE